MRKTGNPYIRGVVVQQNTLGPTSAPTASPTLDPTETPTLPPTLSPTATPTVAPGSPSLSPTPDPTPIATAPQILLQIDCAQGAGGVSTTSGWVDDQDYLISTVGEEASTADTITGVPTGTQNVLKTERWWNVGSGGISGNTAYGIPLANTGDYTVSLYLREGFHTVTSGRIADYFINGVLVADDLDLVAVVGHDAFYAVNYTFTVSSVPFNATVGITASSGDPQISGIVVTWNDAPVTPSPTPDPTPAPTPNPTPNADSVGYNEGTPAYSCSEVLEKTPTAVSGTYWIQAHAGAPEFLGYCDLTTDGGGWLLLGVEMAQNSPSIDSSEEHSGAWPVVPGNTSVPQRYAQSIYDSLVYTPSANVSEYHIMAQDLTGPTAGNDYVMVYALPRNTSLSFGDTSYHALEASNPNLWWRGQSGWYNVTDNSHVNDEWIGLAVYSTFFNGLDPTDQCLVKANFANTTAGGTTGMGGYWFSRRTSLNCGSSTGGARCSYTFDDQCYGIMHWMRWNTLHSTTVSGLSPDQIVN